MKNARIALWLALAFLAGGGTTWLLSVPAARAEEPSKQPYYVCLYERNLPLGESIQAALNLYNGKGYELVTADNGIYCMKRRK